MLRDDATLLDILKAARLAVMFQSNLNKSAFLDDLKTQSAILHQLLIARLQPLEPGEEDEDVSELWC